MTHVALLNVAMTAHAEIFTHALFNIVSFDFIAEALVDVADYIEELFELIESEPLTIHLESAGYESSYFVINAGSILMTALAVFPIAIVLLAVLFSIFAC